MSVLIKNMKMPKSCDECFVRLSLCSAARKIAKSGGPRMWVPTTYRPDDCPLAEISQPHGRLIDADKMLRYINCMMDSPSFAKTIIDSEGNAE